ncbi:hypothetical protein HYX14_01235 [Candidatus Woesearchaeota archaeon]|nr:hypothetical protein [Candidatus Woesearchaeota archaeon]
MAVASFARGSGATGANVVTGAVETAPGTVASCDAIDVGAEKTAQIYISDPDHNELSIKADNVQVENQNGLNLYNPVTKEIATLRIKEGGLLVEAPLKKDKSGKYVRGIIGADKIATGYNGIIVQGKATRPLYGTYVVTNIKPFNDEGEVFCEDKDDIAIAGGCQCGSDSWVEASGPSPAITKKKWDVQTKTWDQCETYEDWTSLPGLYGLIIDEKQLTCATKSSTTITAQGKFNEVSGWYCNCKKTENPKSAYVVCIDSTPW